MNNPEGPMRAAYMLKTIVANLDNQKISDFEFREFCRNSLSDFPDLDLDYRRPRNTDPIG